MFGNQPYTFDRVFRGLITVGVIYAAVRLLAILSDVLIPFILALLLAYLLNPIVVWVQKRVRSHVAAVFITLWGVVLIFITIVLFVFPIIMNEVSHMGHIVRRLVTDVDLIQRAAEILPANIWSTIQQYAKEEEIRELLKQSDLLSIGQTVGKKILPGVWGILSGTTSFLFAVIGFLVVALYLVFLLLDYQHLKAEWKRLLPVSWRNPILHFLQEFDYGMHRYFRGQALIASTVGILFALGFFLIGLPMGILLGLFIGLLNMIPYLQIIGLLPAVIFAIIMALESGGNIVSAVGLTLLVFAVVQIIQDMFLTPKIMGKVTGLSPAMILLSVSIWGKLLGFLGLVVALPMTCLLLAYYKRLLADNHS